MAGSADDLLARAAAARFDAQAAARLGPLVGEAVATAVGNWLADYGSTNGVLVNGQRITKQFLKDGDTLRIGMVELEFKLKG